MPEKNTQTSSGKSRVVRKTRPGLVIAGIILTGIAIVLGWYYYRIIKPVINTGGKKSVYLYIHTGSGFAAVKDSLVKKGYLTDQAAFEWLARYKHYDQRVRPGKYRLVNGMQNNALVNLLRSGSQETVQVTIQNVRTRAELAGRIGRRLEVDSVHLFRMFSDRDYLTRFGLTPTTLFTLFIPDTYDFFWNTSGDQLFQRMAREYDRFWNTARKRQADSLRMTIAEIVTLASIVEKETNKNDEKPVIAGVYLNRLMKDIPLQADPTVVFAWNDFTIRRVSKMQTGIKSPYNTYYRTGLPPGPICLPSVASIEAVLHPAKHSYIYFCARDDLSGYHNFATDLEGHNRNARKYQKALDKMNIR